MTPKLTTAVAAIERRGILLVFPIANQAEPRSLWSELHPKARMRWAWDESGDDRVVALWHLRERLAESRKVVYAKWFRGRATFFSKRVFRAMLATLHAAGEPTAGLGRAARELLDLLEEDSPQPTKRLRHAADLAGRVNETTYARAMKELWSRLLVVGTGEVEEGGFPSLAVGATRLVFEETWLEATEPRADDAEHLARVLAEAPLFRRELEKARAAIAHASSSSPLG